jgi:hypothetical protein
MYHVLTLLLFFASSHTHHRHPGHTTPYSSGAERPAC